MSDVDNSIMANFQGKIKGISRENCVRSNDNNPAGMLFYENRLYDWLVKYPTDYLDYSAILNYDDENDAVPISVTLRYIGVRNGKRVAIRFRSPKEATDPDTHVTSVTLMNRTNGAVINYQNGYILVIKKHKK